MVLRQSIYAYLSLTAALLWFTCIAPIGTAETVLLDFNSPTCGPCRQMRPTIRRLVEAGFKVKHVDISRDSRTAAQFGVNQVPTFIVLVDGKETNRTIGATSYDRLSKMLTFSNSNSNLQFVADQVPSTFATPETNVPPASTTPPVAALPGRVVPVGPSAVSSPFPQPTTNTPPLNRVASQAPRQQASVAGSAVADSRLIQATVKVAITDPDGTSAGTGTVVDARSGEALILTCGHLFRSSKGQGPITITMYQAGPSGAEVRSTAVGRLINYDLERDLALVSFRPNVPIQPIPIAQAGTVLTPGVAVKSVGCNNGQNPTVLSTKITAVDRYQGPPNVEAAGAPVEGRSGGGLFNAQGQLIGVCFAADPKGNEGLYSSLPSIQAKLDSLGLTTIYQSPANDATPAPAAQVAQQLPPAPAATDFAVRGQAPKPLPPPVTDMPFAEVVKPASPPATLNAVEQATLEEIQNRAADSEVICIIRPKSPNGKSEVITLNTASPEFVKALAGAAGSQRPVPTASSGNRPLR